MLRLCEPSGVNVLSFANAKDAQFVDFLFFNCLFLHSVWDEALAFSHFLSPIRAGLARWHGFQGGVVGTAVCENFK